ncbi:Mechanosensory protein 2, partial [Fragariocoptes setiger]
MTSSASQQQQPADQYLVEEEEGGQYLANNNNSSPILDLVQQHDSATQQQQQQRASVSFHNGEPPSSTPLDDEPMSMAVPYGYGQAQNHRMNSLYRRNGGGTPMSLGPPPLRLDDSPTIRGSMSSSPRGSSGQQQQYMLTQSGLERQGSLIVGTQRFRQRYATSSDSAGLCALFLTALSILLIIGTMPLSLFFCIKVVQEYERVVIFRLGRLLKGGARGPGIFFIIPCIDAYCKVDLRTVSFDVPPQEILSKDSVTVAVDAVVYYRISNATIAVSNVEDYGRSTRLLAATTLRNVLGTKNLSEILSERETISHIMQSSLDEATEPWGVKVERVEIKDVRLPVQLQRAMAAEAEAAREARAKVIAAEGEQKAANALKEAAEVISISPQALQLRYLQTLNSIAAEKNSTIVFPIPLDMFSGFQRYQTSGAPMPSASTQPNTQALKLKDPSQV